MRDAPEMRLSLGDDEPGLQACLLRFIRDTKEDPELAMSDGALRTAYLQIKGKRIKDEADRSSVVREHIEVFYNGIFWYLYGYYKEALAENVMVIAAYGEAVSPLLRNLSGLSLTLISYVSGKKHLLSFSGNTSSATMHSLRLVSFQNAQQSTPVKGEKPMSSSLIARCKTPIFLVSYPDDHFRRRVANMRYRFRGR